MRTTKDKDWENHLKLGGWADSFDSFDDTDEFVPGKVVNIVQLFEKLRPKYRGLKWSAPWKNDMDNYPAGYLVVDAKKGDDNTITVRAIARQEDFFDKDTSY